MQDSSQPVDIFLGLFMALFSAIGLIICLFFLLMALAIFAWWLYSNIFSANVEATIIGIRAYKKDTTIEDGKRIKTTPYNMYSPLLSCKFTNGNVVNGHLSASQNWIPEKWFPGSKIKAEQTPSDLHSFNEAAGNTLLISSLVIGFAACAFAYNIEINKYTIIILSLLLLRFIYKLHKRDLLGKTYDFVVNSRWIELKKRLPQDRKSFLKRKKEAEQEKDWHKLSPDEISAILHKQHKNFFRWAFPIWLLASAGLLGVAYIKSAEKLMPLYMNGAKVPVIAQKYPLELTEAGIPIIISLLLLLQITSKALRLANKKNSFKSKLS
jgi:hypothetical protein